MKRKTQQRDAMLKALDTASGPLTADELWQKAKGLEPKIGMATIYRNLKSLMQEEVVQEVHLPKQKTRFERKIAGHRHYFFCDNCKKVLYIQASCPVAALDGVTLASGFSIRRHSLTFYGLCSSCQQ